MEPPPEQDRGTSGDKGTPQPPGEVGGGSEVPPPPAVGQGGCAPHPPQNEHPQDDAPEPQSAEDGVSPAGPRAAAGGATSPAEPPPARTPARDAEEDFYCVKWIDWKGERTPVVTQSANGPCPLLALMNVLLLRWKAGGFGRAWGLWGFSLSPPSSQGEGPGDCPQPVCAPR